jgi:hypothetical protein
MVRVEFGKARCRFHGGLSTGPKTEAGRIRIAEANDGAGVLTVSDATGTPMMRKGAGPAENPLFHEVLPEQP